VYNCAMRTFASNLATWIGSALIVLFFAIVVGSILLDLLS